ncbi:hypothetical protein FBU59_006179 [Linderina macrospora]|uniref:Uncharacterized protein n=1 Tax=Linderina macrospora TaxID=4868 RepID=A0ACC1J0L7_9FUNG|nr:hypothetical protein FBU59_006179 [Linderina macrospora]
MRLVRMSPLKFFKLVEILEPHKAFSGRMSKQREVAFQIALVLIRLGSTADRVHTMAKRYKISLVTIGMLEARVVSAILDKMKSYATWPRNPTDIVHGTSQDSAPASHSTNRVGYLAAGKIYLAFAPTYRKTEFVAPEDTDITRGEAFCIRVLAVISPTTNRFMHFYAGKPGSVSSSSLLKSSLLFRKQKKIFRNDQHILTDTGSRENSDTHGAIPYRMEQFLTLFELNNGEYKETTADRTSQDAARAIGQTAWMWKTIFRQLNSLHIRIQGEKSLKEANSAIVATVYLFNYLQPTAEYVRTLIRLDGMGT